MARMVGFVHRPSLARGQILMGERDSAEPHTQGEIVGLDYPVYLTTGCLVDKVLTIFLKMVSYCHKAKVKRAPKCTSQMAP